MKRKIYTQLLDWKNNRNGKVALLIEGARRIGKSYIVEEFAKNEYASYILIDFNKVSNLVKRWFVDYMEDLDIYPVVYDTFVIIFFVPLHQKSAPLDDSQDRHSVSYGAAHGGLCAA